MTKTPFGRIPNRRQLKNARRHAKVVRKHRMYRTAVAEFGAAKVWCRLNNPLPNISEVDSVTQFDNHSSTSPCVDFCEMDSKRNANENRSVSSETCLFKKCVVAKSPTSMTCPVEMEGREHSLQEEESRGQLSDEHTDRYLSHYFTQSVKSDLSHDSVVSSSPDSCTDYSKLRALFSDVSVETISDFCRLFGQMSDTNAPAHETISEFRRLFSQMSEIDVTSSKETVSDFRRLFRDTSVTSVTSRDTITGFGRLFAQLSASDLGAAKKSEIAKFFCAFCNGVMSESDLTDGLNSSDSITDYHMLRNLFSDVSKETISDFARQFQFSEDEKTEWDCGNVDLWESVPPQSPWKALDSISEDKATTSDVMRGITALFGIHSMTSVDSMSLLSSDTSVEQVSSTSLLGNLFSTGSTVNLEDEELCKERNKALNAKDLSQYLQSDDEQTRADKSLGISEFVRRVDALFEQYRASLSRIAGLEEEIADLKRSAPK